MTNDQSPAMILLEFAIALAIFGAILFAIAKIAAWEDKRPRSINQADDKSDKKTRGD